MKEACEITKKIAQMNATEGPEETLNILRKYAIDYQRLEDGYGLFPEKCLYNDSKEKPALRLEEALEVMPQQPIAIWLNDQATFVNAKNRLIKDGFISVNQQSVKTLQEYRNCFSLEFICISTLRYFIGNKNQEAQFVSTKEKRDSILKAFEKPKHELNKHGGIYFTCESKQHLLNYLLKDLSSDIGRNVYTTGKTHPDALRELLTKELMKALFWVFDPTAIRHTTVADIALGITSVFFDAAMDRSDAAEIAKAISQSIIEDEEFKKMTVGEILAREGLAAMGL